MDGSKILSVGDLIFCAFATGSAPSIISITPEISTTFPTNRKNSKSPEFEDFEFFVNSFF